MTTSWMEAGAVMKLSKQMWAIVSRRTGWLYPFFAYSRREAIAAHLEMYAPNDPDAWRTYRREDKAVKVTVTWEEP